jgi:hypothetical protein
MNDLQIQKVIDQYVKNRQYQRDYYRNRYNTDEDFKNKAKDNAKTYYTNNIDKNMKLIKNFYKQKEDTDIG